MIARTLRDYGAYMGDYADGAPILYAESAPSAIEAWKEIGLTKETLASIFTPEMIKKYFHVEKLPTIQLGESVTIDVGGKEYGFWAGKSKTIFSDVVKTFRAKGNQWSGKRYRFVKGSEILGEMVANGKYFDIVGREDLRDAEIQVEYYYDNKWWPIMWFSFSS